MELTSTDFACEDASSSKLRKRKSVGERKSLGERKYLGESNEERCPKTKKSKRAKKEGQESTDGNVVGENVEAKIKLYDIVVVSKVQGRTETKTTILGRMSQTYLPDTVIGEYAEMHVFGSIYEICASSQKINVLKRNPQGKLLDAYFDSKILCCVVGVPKEYVVEQKINDN